MNPLDILAALAGGGGLPGLALSALGGDQGAAVGGILQGLAGGGLLPSLLRHRDQIPPELLGLLGGGGLLAGRAF